MKISVNEALRLKNELRGNLNNVLQETRNNAYYGIKKEFAEKDSKEFEDTTDYNKEPIDRLFSKAQNLVQYLVELETNIQNFNANSGITKLVLLVKNLEVLISRYESVLQFSTPYKRKENPNPLFGKETPREFYVDYTPLYTKKELKEIIKDLKRNLREAQNKIYTLNAETIEVNFEYSDLE